MRARTILATLVCAALCAGAGAAAERGLTLDVESLEGDEPGVELASTPQEFQALKARHLAAAASRRTRLAQPAKTLTVDCTKGQSIQAVIDKEPGPVEIEVRGICQENVRIERKQVTLRGLDPVTDGIHGVADPAALAALEIFYTDGARLENLSISNGPSLGVAIFYSFVEMENCRAVGNAGIGVHVSASSFLDALAVTMSNNGQNGLTANRGSFVFCTGCVLQDNAFFAAIANFGGLLTLLDSTVSGIRGLRANNGAYADIDCLSFATSFPCSLNVTQTAALGSNGTAVLFGAGDFSGQLQAFDRGLVGLFGARQLATGLTPGGAPRTNVVSGLSTLSAEPLEDENGVVHQSQIKGNTRVEYFSRALLVDATVVDGTLTCSSAGDAWADPGVTATPGGSITGCEHASIPPAP